MTTNPPLGQPAQAPRAPAPSDTRALQLSTQHLIRLRVWFTACVRLLALAFLGVGVFWAVATACFATLQAIQGYSPGWEEVVFFLIIPGVPSVVVFVALWFAAGPLGRWLISAKPGRLQCPRCRYDLTELVGGRCPECGYQVDAPDPSTAPSASAHVQRVRLVVGAVMNIALVLGLLAFWIVQAMMRLAERGRSSYGRRGFEESLNESVEYYTVVGMASLGLLLLIALNSYLVRFIVPMELVRPVTEGALRKAQEKANRKAADQ
ncbi:MAG: hypothetical protein ACIAS6_13095 [Phycisphaerales bacterium JB060]